MACLSFIFGVDSIIGLFFFIMIFSSKTNTDKQFKKSHLDDLIDDETGLTKKQIK
jgi:hypothetical protein